MKKVFLFLMIFLSIFTLTGCGNKNIEGELTDLMAEIDTELDEEVKSRLFITELDQENVSNYLGTDEIKFQEGIAEENMVGSIAYSVILLRVDDDQDEKVKKQIKENINPRKWICVGVEDSDVIIKNKGNLIIAIVIQDEENRAIIEKGFDEL